VISACEIGYEKISPLAVTDLQQSSDPGTDTQAKLMLYQQEAVKHHLAMARGRPRTASLSCVFLPYLIPGFPCLIEDSTGPFFGIIASIQHSMPCNGLPSTVVEISFVRECYQLGGMDRTPPLPIWLNSLFTPQQITATYQNYLGLDNEFDPTANTITRTAMVSQADITAQTGQASGQAGVAPNCNMDALASLVVPVPLYPADLGGPQTMSTGTYAEAFRKLPAEIRDLAFLQYQYRIGMDIIQYCSFHGLVPPSSSATLVNGQLNILPNNLFGATGTSVATGNPLFAYAQGLQFTPTPSPGGYGYWNAVGNPFMPDRQNAALVIQQAIAKRITYI
jgi:hypothetical protein